MQTQTLPLEIGRGQYGEWRSFVVSWLERLAQEAVYLEPSLRDRLSERTRRGLELSLSREFPNEELDGIKGVADEILAYNRELQGAIDQISSELGDVLKSVAQLGEQPDVDAEYLDALSQVTRDAQRSEQLPALRDRLRASVAVLESRVVERRQRQRQRQIIDNLQNRVMVLEKLLDGPVHRQVQTVNSIQGRSVQQDPCTGLPARGEAEAALRKACVATSPSTKRYAAVFYVQRLTKINTKYGRAVGNAILMLIGQELAMRVIDQADALFRWSGPAFLAILEREEGVRALESEVNRFLGIPFEHHIDSPDKFLTIPLRLTGHVVGLHGNTFAEICEDIEGFILRTSGEN